MLCMTVHALNGRGVRGASLRGVARRGQGVGRGAGRAQCAGGSGLRHTCPRSPHHVLFECCANDCVFMAVKLLQVLVLGVIAAAAEDGALFPVLCSSHVLARARVYGGGRMREPCLPPPGQTPA